MPTHRPTPRSSPLLPAATTIAALLTGAGTANPAHGATGKNTTTCGGSQTVAYSPGLRARSRDITIHGTSTLTGCASSADPGITAGRSTFHATGRLSCVSGRYSGTRKVVWNNGRTSTMSFRATVSANAGQSVATVRGTVTDGEFHGQKWSAAFTMFPARPDACTTAEGLPTAAGRLLLAIGSSVPGLSAGPPEPTLR
jgi:hypothetical protein